MTAVVPSIAAQAKASVAAVCRVLQVPRSSVYAHRRKRGSARAKGNQSLDVAIKAAFAASKRRYGSPRIHQSLVREGTRVGRHRVASRMRALGLQARRPKRFHRTTQSNPAHVPAPNTLARRFDGWKPNEAWVADITYLWTRAGWVYLAILVDLGSRAIAGWSVGAHCDTALALRALEAAVAHRQPKSGLLHHSDRGSTYTAHDYRARLRALGFECSMSRKGNCWDNAVAESVNGMIKTELFDDSIPRDIDDVKHQLFTYIEVFYNRQRLHSSLGYVTPAEKEALAFEEAKVA